MTRPWRLPLSLVPVVSSLVLVRAVPAALADVPPTPASSSSPAPPPSSSPAAPSPPGGPDDSLDDDSGFGKPSENAPATIRTHAYTLTECLALADRNFPNLWAARARLALAHAQLEEARWTPWFQWFAQSSFGVAPTLSGTVVFPQSNLSNRNITSIGNLEPFLGFGLSGVVPLYTFGKITSALDAADANVRVSEWDMEKARQQMRMDLRRAYYGVQLARDAKEVFSDALDRLDKGIKGMKDKLAKADPNVSEVDRLRLEEYRQEVVVQSLQVPKGEAYALAGLRFLTGVQTAFDVPDEPLTRPDRPLVAIAQYLEAARILRPDVNMARAGIVARKALLEYNRAKLYPDLGLGLGADFVSTPSAVPQENVWASDNWNHFYYYFGFGIRWSLDLLPQAARIQGAESQLEETRALERLALGTRCSKSRRPMPTRSRPRPARRPGTRPNTSRSNGSRRCRTTSTSARWTSEASSSRCARTPTPAASTSTP
jgi:multidrug efflux system outer membrane protein